MTEVTEEKVEVEKAEIERVNMNWPIGLKDRVRKHTGSRGLTSFVAEAVETRLVDEDRVKTLEKEIDELRYLVQLLSDRYVMGGDHENRESFLMELDLPAWLRTDGWPSELAKLVPKQDPVGESMRSPTPPAPVVGQPKAEVPVAPKKPAESVVTGPLVDPLRTQGGDDLFAKVQAKAAEKGIDITGAGLVPASSIQAPPNAGPHNHAWERIDGVRSCACGAWIDDAVLPNGVVRESGWRPGDLLEPAPLAEEQPKAVARPPARALDDFDVDF